MRCGVRFLPHCAPVLLLPLYLASHGRLLTRALLAGTTRAYITRHVTGVSEGHTAVLRLVGIGYRAAIEARPKSETYPGQKFLSMKLGYTHPIEMAVPKGVEASVPSQTRILLEGVSREDVMSFAGKIREKRKPEPYKGKGVFINDETIKLKQKKIK